MKNGSGSRDDWIVLTDACDCCDVVVKDGSGSSNGRSITSDAPEICGATTVDLFSGSGDTGNSSSKNIFDL